MRYTAVLSFLLVGLSPLSHAAPSRADARSMHPAGQTVKMEERHLPWMGDDEGEEGPEGPRIGRLLSLLPLLGGDEEEDDNNSTGLTRWPFPGDEDQEDGELLPGKRHFPWMGDDEETGPVDENGI
ncbi:hypothetical protein ATEIFO6365_0011007800 [Aspergillus terreus]|uniref:Uncharacterized protein n=1 Tax=Aspergillus terreus TaxID=33178 RepID=A0A5M3YY49_ASPTE|nr:hypothetical protein ATETN484_0006007800 [Aspergillus terreus]GFF19819.1 hypothetical protein ATEIFO6365_0011007800 [Aspergillus terreus]